MGQRVIKEVDGVQTIFHYDFDGKLIAEALANGTITKEYLYKYNDRLAMVDVATGNLYLYLNDYLGTPQMLTDESNTVVWEALYKPFGEGEVNPNSSIVNNLRLPGQYYDAETGFHYNYFRYYDPSTGRYLRPDPIGLAGGINLFAYTENNPINLIDPFGLAEWKGYLTVTAGGEIFGGGIVIGAFESESYNGKRSNVVLIGVMGGVTAGIPVSTTTGEITLVTPGAPNPKDFSGKISFISANAGLVKTGGASHITIGKAKSEDIFSFQYGLDASTSGYIGWSFVIAKQSYDIAENKNILCEGKCF